MSAQRDRELDELFEQDSDLGEVANSYGPVLLGAACLGR